MARDTGHPYVTAIQTVQNHPYTGCASWRTPSIHIMDPKTIHTARPIVQGIRYGHPYDTGRQYWPSMAAERPLRPMKRPLHSFSAFPLQDLNKISWRFHLVRPSQPHWRSMSNGYILHIYVAAIHSGHSYWPSKHMSSRYGQKTVRYTVSASWRTTIHTESIHTADQ